MISSMRQYQPHHPHPQRVPPHGKLLLQHATTIMPLLKHVLWYEDFRFMLAEAIHN